MPRKLLILFSAAAFGAGAAVGLWMTSKEAPGTTSGAPQAAVAPWDPALGSPPVFTDVTAASGISFRHENGLTGKNQYLEIMGGGIAAFDFDNDGWLDLYFVNGNRISGPPDPSITGRLYRNERNGTFTDVTARAGLARAIYGQGACAGDHDNDGDPDLFLSNFGPDILFRNDGNGSFTDVTAAAGVGDPGWGQSSSFLDFDGDGWLDLYVQNYLAFAPSPDLQAAIHVGERKVVDYPSPLAFPGSSSRLYRNRRDGTFEDVTERAGLLRDGKGMGVACADLDGDRLTDVFAANDTAENFLFLGRPGGVFQEVGLTAGVAFDGNGVPEASMGVDVGDFDGDLLPDLIVPCLRNQGFALYRNRGGWFEDVSVPSGIAAATMSFTGFSASFLDHDNDGDLDIYFTNGGVRRDERSTPEAPYEEQYGMPDLLLANDGRGRYADVSSRAGPWFRQRRIGRGSVAADLDNDGDQDLVVSNLAGPAVVLRNDTASASWITLRLVSRDGRRDPLGTTVRIEAGGRAQRAEVHGAVTYLSQGDRRIHFGLGRATGVDLLEVHWPDGERQTLRNLPARRILELKQGQPAQ